MADQQDPTERFKIDQLLEDNRRLRLMLAHAYSGVSKLYRDDGECFDGSVRPHIDYVRDTVDEIGQKIIERGMANLKEAGIEI